MQCEITEKQSVFNDEGKVICAGWARNALFDYIKDESSISRRNNERDCYFINNNEVSLYISIENLGKEFLIKIAIADLKYGGVIYDFIKKICTFAKNELPQSDCSSELIYNDKRINLQITNSLNEKILKCDFSEFGGSKNLYFNITLKKFDGESLNQLAPFERDRRYFYLKRFAPKFSAKGEIKVGGIQYHLNENTSRAYFDWTRFAKPRKHNYHRLSSDCIINGKRFSLCLANRVGDNRYGNENCFFVDGKITKLSQINVKSSNGRLDRPWYFKAGVSAVDITFKPFTVKGEPMIANMDKTSVIFGRLYGHIKHIDYAEPIILDNAQAHMVLSEF